MKQIEFDLGMDPPHTPTIAFAPEVQEALVPLMATAIIAVHHAGKEVRDDARGAES